MSSSHNARDLWIDTTELKEKKRKRQTRPISKLLNPLARCGGYSVAVALNFTQTKLAMPATKQSTISSFFSPRRKDAENMQTFSAEICENASDTAPSKSEERSTDFECQTFMKNSNRDLSDMRSARCFGEQSGDVLETDHTNDSCKWEKEQTFLRLIRGYESEEEDDEEPMGKRRHSVPSSVPSSADKQALIQCLPVPETLTFNHWEQNTPDSQCLDTKYLERESSVFSASQISERIFRAQLPLGEHTSTQNRRSPAKHSGKENCPSNNNNKNTTKGKDLGWSRSPLKMRPKSPSCLAAKSRPWEASCQSPQKPVLKCAQKETETDSMASLFTQDTQGFRVIAHRHHQSWSPLKDRTKNASPGAGCEFFVAALDGDCEEEEAEMLFTQDSQGNLVIKH